MTQRASVVEAESYEVESRVQVVALVTSAGGLEALSAVLRELPEDFPAAVVVGQHLGGQGSTLVDILARRTRLPVEWACEGGLLRAGYVTVCPPRTLLEILPDGTCTTRAIDSTLHDRPLDVLLTSVGDSFGAAAVAVVLTGMGNDASAGAAAVRAAGGLVLAQSEDTAEQPAMPAAAVAAGAVDLVLPLYDVGAAVMDVVAGNPLPQTDHEKEAIRLTFGDSGHVATLARGIDWAATPLGRVAEWPDAQRAVTRLAMDSPNGVTLFLGPHHIVLSNDAAVAPTGGPGAHARVFGRPYAEAYPEAVDYMLPVLARVLAGEHVHQEVTCVPYERHGQLEEVWFDFNYTPIRAADGTVLGVHQTFLERTDEVVRGRRLQTLNRLSSLETAGGRNDAIAAGIGVLEDAADVPFAAAYLIGRGSAEASLLTACGVEPGSGMAPQRQPLKGSVWPLERALTEGGEVVLDDLARRFRGQRVGDAELSLEHAVLHPIHDDADKGVVGVLVLGVHPRIRLDQGYREFLALVGETVAAKANEAHARQRERQRLEHLSELDRTKTQFFSNVSHEFRTPLTLMLGPLEDLVHDGHGVPAERMSDLELIRRNARRLLRLVGTMLDFSQIEAGRLRARFTPVDLAERTREIVAQFESAAARVGIDLRVDLEELPEPVWVDVEMWEKIVSNLLSNALKFTFDGAIDVTLRALPKHAELVVRDTGVGIAEEELPHIFKRFHRVRDTSARTYEGAGIGLALADELVRRHHGRIRATSTVGEGTTLTVWIPLGRRPTMPDSPPKEPPQATAVAAAIAEEVMQWGEAPEAQSIADDDSALRQSLRAFAPGARVLVADDNKDMRDYLKRLLSPHWKLELAAEGTTALARARENRPDLIIADVMMPGLDGFALLRELRREPTLKSIPVVLVTARADEEAAIEALLAGADDYIVKPFSARELVARVGGQLELARARNRAFELNEFLVRFSDTARGLAEPRAIAETACRMVADELRASRTVWAEIDREAREYVADWVVGADGAAAQLRWPLDPHEPYTADHLAGRTVVYADTTDDPRITDGTKRKMTEQGLRAGIAVPVCLDGELHAVLSVGHSEPRLWAPEEVALVEAFAGRAWAEIERARAEEALRESEEKYRTVFESMDEGFLIHEMVRDAAGRVVDYRLLEANPAHQRATGLPPDTIGMLGSEFMPHVEQYWLDLFHRVSTSGVAERAEMYNEPTSRWYDVQVSPVCGHDRVAIVFDDVTARKQAEMAIKASEERQAFLLRLSDALRPLGDPAAVRTTAARLLGEHLGANRCLYAEIDGDDWLIEDAFERDVPTLPPGRHDIAQFGRWIIDSHRAGELHVFDDLSSDERFDSAQRDAHAALSIHAGIAVPLVKDGTLVAVLTVHSAAPRQWSEREISLVEETAERTWAAVGRARAERALHEREGWLRGQREALVAALNDAPLADSLEVLVQTTIDAVGPGTRAAFFLANGDGTSLHLVVGMSDGYAEAVDGFAIGPESLACGLAVASGQPVVTTDVHDEPLWKPWVWLADQFDYRGCWSFPILAAGGTFIGSLAIYSQQPRNATQRELDLASLLTQTASIIIARHQEHQARRQAEHAVNGETPSPGRN